MRAGNSGCFARQSASAGASLLSFLAFEVGQQGIGERVGDGLAFVGVQSDNEVGELASRHRQPSHAVDADWIAEFDCESVVLHRERVCDGVGADYVGDCSGEGLETEVEVVIPAEFIGGWGGGFLFLRLRLDCGS